MTQPGFPWWARPALALDRLRPGLADQVAKDIAWLARFPTMARSNIVPLVVVAIPVIFAAVRAFDTATLPAVTVTFRFQDIYTESIPYMVLAAAIGIAAPTLGVLFLASHAAADLVAAFIQPKELSPLPTAVLGRLVSFWVLYLLVAELPILVHDLIAAVKARVKGATAGVKTIAAGVSATVALAWIWGYSATLFMRPVFTWSDLKFPTSNAGWSLLYGSDILAFAIGAISLVTLTLRYVVRPATSVPAPIEADSRRAGLRSLLFGIVVPLALFSSLVTEPIDAVILVAAVLLARPISAIVLRRFGLAQPLAIIPRPVRLIGGVVISIVAGFVIAGVLGVSEVSAFFTMIVAMAVSFIVVRTMLDAEDFVSADIARPSAAATVVSSMAMGLVIWLFSAGWAFADNITGQGDGWQTAAAAAAAAGGAGAMAAASANKPKKEPNPPPWYIPDFAAEFFGYDGPKAPDGPKGSDGSEFGKQRPPDNSY